MGNILSLQRNGLHDNNTYDVIDDLSYTYNGNQVIRIDDDAEDPVYNGCFNFKDGADEDIEYEYDQNGNLTMDLNRDICSIEYNCLNLPERVDFGDDSFILYTYNAKGEKLKTAYFINQMTPAVPQVGGGTGGGQPQMTVTTLKYSNGLIFENNTLKQIPIEGGYVTFNGSSPQYHFYVQDHLGNNRVVCNASGTIEQVNHYYPFGGLMGESEDITSAQSYKYNGKELDRMHGLNLYDYGARQYDGAGVRFTTMDPLSEKYYNVSPYAYCVGNPVMYVDPDGALCSPIYDFDGKFLGTDDEGLQGEAIIMNKKDFKQGMSHSDALSKNEGFNRLQLQKAKINFYSHFSNLPNRPDYDGKLTLEEANNWFREGTGEPLYVSLEKIDLSGIASLGEAYVGQVKSFNLLLNSCSLNDGLVYGNITLKRYPNHTVRAYSDKYDFEMHNPMNPLNWGRNIETIIGRKVAGKGRPFEINIYGSKKITPIFPWIK